MKLSSANKQLQKEFEKAYDLYADAIFRHCYLRVSDRELAKDLMQETFMKTWEYLASGKDIDDVRPFLYRTALNYGPAGWLLGTKAFRSDYVLFVLKYILFYG
jgi:RNA polymerase sigma-70 factor (ECF subfamily)